jgi:hypothetical protein
MSDVPVTPPPAAPAPPPVPAATAAAPGKGLGIASVILAIIPGTGLIGLILGIVGLVISRNAGVKNTPAVVGIILSIVLAIVYIIIVVVAAAALVHAACSDPTYAGSCTTN